MAKCIVDYFKDQCSNKTSSYHHGNLKEEMLKQAVDIIHHEGIETLTLSVLSKRLGTSRSAIYRHFSSKDELMQNVLMYGFEMFETEISEVFKQKDIEIITRLHTMGKIYVSFAMEHPNLYRILFGEKFQDMRAEACPIEDEEKSAGFHALVGLLKEAQEKEIFIVQDPMLQAHVVHSMMHGLVSLYIDGHIHIKDNIDVLHTMAHDTLINGLSLKS